MMCAVPPDFASFAAPRHCGFPAPPLRGIPVSGQRTGNDHSGSTHRLGTECISDMFPKRVARLNRDRPSLKRRQSWL
jgi:hypothetical protein